MADTTFTPNAEQKERMVEMHCKENGKNAVGDTRTQKRNDHP